MTAYTETPLGNALSHMGNGERCSTSSVMECPSCGRVYPDDGRDDPGNCGPCEWSNRWTFEPRAFRLHRRERRPTDVLGLAFRA